jgi:hypothetical protein
MMEKPLKKKNTHAAGQSGKGTFTNIPKRKNKLRKKKENLRCHKRLTRWYSRCLNKQIRAFW